MAKTRTVKEEKKKEIEAQVQALMCMTPEHHLPKAVASLVAKTLETQQESWFQTS